MLIKKHKKTLQCILGSSLLCSCLCLHTLSFVDFHWTCNWMRWEPFNALFFPLYHQSWYFIFSKLNHWILQSPSIASRAMNVFFKCTEISFLILFISDCISLSLLLLSFRSFCMFSEIPFSCQSNHCLLATISFIWKLTKSGTDCPREVATQLQVMLRQGLYYWPGNAYVVPQSSHWCNVKREEGSGTQGRERKTHLKNVLIGFCGHLYCVIIFLKCTCMLLMTQRNILLCLIREFLNHVSDFSPSVFFGYKIKCQQMRQLFDKMW